MPSDRSIRRRSSARLGRRERVPRPRSVRRLGRVRLVASRENSQRRGGLITLCTDFGTSDAYVGVMKGVMLGVDARLTFVDLTHEVPSQEVTVGALLLRSAVEYFPDRTVHLAIVDPGVGSERAPIVVVTERAILVGPDNGLLHPSAVRLGVREVRRIEREDLFRKPLSRTFHGRDIFAPIAARLAAGMEPEKVGPRIDGLLPLALPTPRREEREIHGEVLYVDRFGNLVTNIADADLAAFPARNLSVSIRGVSLAAPVASYSAVPPGAGLAIIGSWGLLEIAVRDGSAAEKLEAARGTPVSVKLS